MIDRWIPRFTVSGSIKDKSTQRNNNKQRTDTLPRQVETPPCKSYGTCCHPPGWYRELNRGPNGGWLAQVCEEERESACDIRGWVVWFTQIAEKKKTNIVNGKRNEKKHKSAIKILNSLLPAIFRIIRRAPRRKVPVPVQRTRPRAPGGAPGPGTDGAIATAAVGAEGVALSRTENEDS